ncbi:MAG: pyruvate kinase, partial [Candidatus Bathyarchaeia archaeon]
MEIPLEGGPVVQKSLTRKANLANRLVITATQMLKSMVDNPRPTRAEVTDVANAILDGTDALMLSEETATGRYPLESVEIMAGIARWTEQSLREDPGHGMIDPQKQRDTVQEGIGRAVSLLAKDLRAAAIVTPTESGHTARLVSKQRPYSPIIA